MSDDVWDVIVLGAGPGGMACATGCAAAGLRVLVVERLGFGGQLVNAPPLTEPVPGEAATGGPDLAGDMANRMLAAGVTCELAEPQAIGRESGPRPWVVRAAGAAHRGRWAVAATGAGPGRLAVPGAARLTGKGVSYCAPCDGPLFAGAEVALVADDRWAAGEALCLADFVRRLYVVSDGERSAWHAGLVEAVAGRGNVDVIDGVAEEVAGADRVEALTVQVSGGGRVVVAVGAVFAAVGVTPNSAAFAGWAALDPDGAIVTDADLRCGTPGLFAVGDVRSGSPLTATGAIADGHAVARHLAATRPGEPRNPVPRSPR